MESATDFVAIKVAYPSQNQAHAAAMQLLEANLIASGQVVTIESAYWWEGEIHVEPEYELTCYTRAVLFDQVEKVVTQGHPYDVAQIVAVPVTHISADFASWIRQYAR